MGVDLGHAGHLAKLVGDVPVEQGAQLHGADSRVRGGLDLELVDLAQRGGDRTQRGCAITGGNGFGGTGESFSDELPRPVDIGSLVEDDGDHRDPELGDRPDLFHVGQAAHRPLHRKREQRFDLQR